MRSAESVVRHVNCDPARNRGDPSVRGEYLITFRIAAHGGDVVDFNANSLFWSAAIKGAVTNRQHDAWTARRRCVCLPVTLGRNIRAPKNGSHAYTSRRRTVNAHPTVSAEPLASR